MYDQSRKRKIKSENTGVISNLIYLKAKQIKLLNVLILVKRLRKTRAPAQDKVIYAVSRDCTVHDFPAQSQSEGVFVVCCDDRAVSAHAESKMHDKT